MRLIAKGRRALVRAGLRVPTLDVRAVRRLPRGLGGQTWTEDDVVRIDLAPSGLCADIVAHELAHAVLEPVTGRTDGHREPVPASLWGVVYSVTYRALVG